MHDTQKMPIAPFQLFAGACLLFACSPTKIEDHASPISCVASEDQGSRIYAEQRLGRNACFLVPRKEFDWNRSFHLGKSQFGPYDGLVEVRSRVETEATEHGLIRISGTLSCKNARPTGPHQCMVYEIG
ncbi:hypothetical protein [Qipengyuania mesophila]|uniref:hypothetical protein n=1 Tax=Qipengyuania mesophila TaxID=2867246 RepID=UPI00355AAAD9